MGGVACRVPRTDIAERRPARWLQLAQLYKLDDNLGGAAADNDEARAFRLLELAKQQAGEGAGTSLGCSFGRFKCKIFFVFR